MIRVNQDKQRLLTPFEKGDIPFSSYPRPQMERDSYLCLNGQWSLAVQKGDRVTPVGEITVPFAPESIASGVEATLEKNEQWIYERSFTLPEDFQKSRVLLHFGAVDQTASVFVNDIEVASHSGGYWPFSCDVTAALCRGNNRLRVTVSDPLDTDLPYGKQCRRRGGMWYTSVSGIWQTVWLESVPKKAVRSLRLTPTLDRVVIEVEGGTREKRLVLHAENGDVEYTFCGDRYTLVPDTPHLWTPEDPYLYHFTLYTGEDCVRSYFALRTVSVGESGGYKRLLLNGKPYFFHGLLDQGYFSDGIYLPSSEEGYRFDVAKMKALGFNTLRKHIKIEPEVFYYECDRQGMLVFQDLVNSGRYHFLIDTALPTVGLKRGIAHRASRRRRQFFEAAAEDTVRHLYNHPCVVYYTLFNEGWGQYDADRLYSAMKVLDDSRIWDATSGWFFEKHSDVQSEHIYFKPLRLTAGEHPLVLSEFGGYSYKVAQHAFNTEKTYGYRFFEERERFCEALETLYLDEVVPAVEKGLCASILTQVSDVEDETNGLLTYDRQVCKVEETAMQAIRRRLDEALERSVAF